MRHRLISPLAASVLLLGVFVTACGSGPDAPLRTGLFGDKPEAGVTDENGTFTYRQGETVTFSLGSNVLGSAIGAPSLTPHHIAPGGFHQRKDAASNIHYFLQKMDVDGSHHNGIEVSEKTRSFFDNEGDAAKVVFSADEVTFHEHVGRILDRHAPAALSVEAPADSDDPSPGEPDFTPPAIVGVETAVPAFIGYTEKAVQNGSEVWNRPVLVSSFAEYENIFGGAVRRYYSIRPADSAQGADFSLTSGGSLQYYRLQEEPGYLLYDSVRLFFENGGIHCYVVAAAPYAGGGVSREALLAGIETAGRKDGPTLLVMPDALRSDYWELAQALIQSAAAKGDRMALLDTYDEDWEQAMNSSNNNLSSDEGAGAVYFPWIGIAEPSGPQPDFRRFSDAGVPLSDVLKSKASELYSGDQLSSVFGLIDQMPVTTDPAALNAQLADALPLLADLESRMRNGGAGQKISVPPSGAVAGVFARVDSNRGVWNAPANETLNGALAATAMPNSVQQGILNDHSINVIKPLPGRGIVIWGARTVSTKVQYRYVNVVRENMYVQQSIQHGLEEFASRPNDATTWAQVKGVMDDFLTALWKNGGLVRNPTVGPFAVHVGLESGVMSQYDVQNGIMRALVQLYYTNPNESYMLSFSQTMENG